MLHASTQVGPSREGAFGLILTLSDYPPCLMWYSLVSYCPALHSRCDGKKDCNIDGGSDEQNCLEFVCAAGSRKCADKIQCVDNSAICDGVTDCLDGSDELCKAACLQEPLEKKAIVKSCIEDSTKCFPVERFCDSVADCPVGTDEASSGCSCEGWGMVTYKTRDSKLCTFKDWDMDVNQTSAIDLDEEAFSTGERALVDKNAFGSNAF